MARNGESSWKGGVCGVVFTGCDSENEAPVMQEACCGVLLEASA